MSTSISSLFPNTSSTAASSSSSTAASQPAGTTATDTVQLSEAQQIYQLYSQGQTVTQISTALNLSVEAVKSYLNISNTTG